MSDKLLLVFLRDFAKQGYSYVYFTFRILYCDAYYASAFLSVPLHCLTTVLTMFKNHNFISRLNWSAVTKLRLSKCVNLDDDIRLNRLA